MNALSRWAERLPSTAKRDPRLMSGRQFARELMREKARSMRRATPFCVLTIDLLSGGLRRPQRALARLLHRNLRMTDCKGEIGRTKYCVLLPDTGDSGGRAVLERLRNLISRAGISATLTLQSHNPGGGADDTKSDGDVDASDGHHGRRAEDFAHAAGGQTVEYGTALVGDDAAFDAPVPQMSLTKRAIDLVGASIGLVLASPLLVASYIAIRATSQGPAIFKQTREGFRGQPFTIYKFRTMVVNAEQSQAALRELSHRDGPAFKLRCDPRVTKVGRILRASCIDELPQLWNVLRGDMSLVGPRPLPWHESRACSRWQRRRLDVLPGMTCYWQVNKSQATTFDEWMRMDLRYVDRSGLWQDLGLIAQTLTVPLLGRGSD